MTEENVGQDYLDWIAGTVGKPIGMGDAWQAAHNFYAPKLTEAEAVEAFEELIYKAVVDFEGGVYSTKFAERMIGDLKSAGMTFKSEEK